MSCCIEHCKKEAEHSLYFGEYNYCEEHYEGHIVGECKGCGTEIHDSWDWGPRMCDDFCRRCAKTHDDKHCDICNADDSDDEDEEDEVENGIKFAIDTEGIPCWEHPDEGWADADDREFLSDEFRSAIEKHSKFRGWNR